MSGCTTYVYNPEPPPPPPEPAPEVQYVPTPPPEPAQPVYTPPPAYAPPPQPVVVVEIRTENDFYEPLGHYGHWVDVGGYGRCWTPDGVDRDWRPYTQGHWERTDAGWYWVSDEPWGWATCHYGRWFFDPNFGWMWVPQTQWAPAWVAWRDGDEYTGWAPLPPRVRFGPDGDLERPDEDIDPHSFCFVERRRMLEPQRPQTVIVNNITIVQKTVNITKITVVNKTVINEGPSADVVARAAGREIYVVPAHALRAKHEAPVIANDHLRTKVVQTSMPLPATHNPQGLHGNEARNPRPNEPVQPQRVTAPEQPNRPPEQRRPEQVQTVVQPNQPGYPQGYRPPRTGAPEQPKNEQSYPPNQAKEHEQNPNKPAHPPQPNREGVEVNRPVQPGKRPEPRPESNQPQFHQIPNQPKPEQNPPGRPPGQHENELNKPSQPGHNPPSKPELEKQKKGGEKPHPQQEEGNRHSSTNAPPQQR